MGQCVELVSLIIYLQQLGHKFLGKSPWRLIGSGVTFYFPSRAGQDQPTRPEPSLPYSSARAGDTSKVVPYHSPAEGFGGRP